MKYARFVSQAVTGGAEVRTIDVLNMADYEPRPAWGQTDEALIDRLFEHQKAGWVAAGAWFVQVPDGVQSGAVVTNGGGMTAANYTNPDGTDGDGQAP